MSRLDDLAPRGRPRGWRATAWLIAIAVTVLIVWTYFAELEEVAVAEGEVVPQGQVKVVQHLEGGIIKRIFVTEGDAVRAGDPLLQLDLGIYGSTREEQQIELDGLLITRARLDAESRGAALAFPEDESARRPDLVAAERQTYEGHRREQFSTIAVLKEQARQRELDLQQLRVQLKSAENNLLLARERFVMSADLLAEGLTPRIEHVQLQQEVAALDGEVAGLEAALPRAKAGIAEALARIDEERLRFRRRALEELAEVERRVARTREVLSRATDQVTRTEIKSPIDGVVKSLRYHTIGGVVRPGEALMEIVPSQEKLVIEARLNPTDIGYVRVGQAAMVKISTYDFARYGGLEGRVAYISADSHVDASTGEAYFRVVAETDRTYLGSGPDDLPIAPGMEATVDIHTGSKSVLAYLLKPVIKVKAEAFRER